MTYLCECIPQRNQDDILCVIKCVIEDVFPTSGCVFNVEKSEKIEASHGDVVKRLQPAIRAELGTHRKHPHDHGDHVDGAGDRTPVLETGREESDRNHTGLEYEQVPAELHHCPRERHGT